MHWFDQLELLPDLSDQEKDKLLALLNDPSRVRDPALYFRHATTTPVRAVTSLKELLYPTGMNTTPPCFSPGAIAHSFVIIEAALLQSSGACWCFIWTQHPVQLYCQ